MSPRLVFFAEARACTAGNVRERGPDRDTYEEADYDAEAFRAKWVLDTNVRVRETESLVEFDPGKRTAIPMVYGLLPVDFPFFVRLSSCIGFEDPRDLQNLVEDLHALSQEKNAGCAGDIAVSKVLDQLVDMLADARVEIGGRKR